MTRVAIINLDTQKCENVSVDERDISLIVLPHPYLAIDLDATPAIDWVWREDSQQWESVEGIGNGGIGDDWFNGKLIQPHP